MKKYEIEYSLEFRGENGYGSMDCDGILTKDHLADLKNPNKTTFGADPPEGSIFPGLVNNPHVAKYHGAIVLGGGGNLGYFDQSQTGAVIIDAVGNKGVIGRKRNDKGIESCVLLPKNFTGNQATMTLYFGKENLHTGDIEKTPYKLAITVVMK